MLYTVLTFSLTILIASKYLCSVLCNTQAVTFVKKFDWTTVKVKFRGTLAAGYGHQAEPWCQWRILFNGNDCTDPGNIESINYNHENDTLHHKASGSKFNLHKVKVKLKQFHGHTPS